MNIPSPVAQKEGEGKRRANLVANYVPRKLYTVANYAPNFDVNVSVVWGETWVVIEVRVLNNLSSEASSKTYTVVYQGDFLITKAIFDV